MRLSSSVGEEAEVLGALQARAEGKGRCWKVLYWAFPEASAETGNIEGTYSTICCRNEMHSNKK